MQQIKQGCRGMGVLIGINVDRILFLVMLGIALVAAAAVAQL